MNPQTYAQMLQLQQQKGAPLTSQGQAPMQQQAPAEAPRYDLNNPLSEGSMAAVNAARESMKGKSGKKPSIFHNVLNGILGTVKNAGLAKLRGSNIGAERQLGHFYKTQEEEEAQKAQENEKILQFLQTNEIMKQKQANEIAMQNHKAAQLSEQRRHHDMQSRHQGAHSDYYRAMAEKARAGGYGEQEVLPEWGYSFKGMSPSERNLARKDMLERVHKPNEMKKARETLKEMQVIAGKFPHLSKSFAAVLSPEDSGGIANTVKRWAMNQEDTDAIAKFKKLRSDLVIHNTKALGATRANMFLEKTIKEASPDYGMTPEVVDYMGKHFDKVYYEPAMEDSKNVRRAIKGGFGALKPLIEEDAEAKGVSKSPMSSLSKEELLSIMNE